MPADKKTLTIDYCDRISTLALWWKSIFLLPPWGYMITPFIGGLALLFYSSAIVPIYYGLLIYFGIYLLEDVLKARIIIKDSFFRHAFRVLDMNKLQSAGLDYAGKETLPKKLTLSFADGQTYSLKLSRLNLDDFQKLLTFIETNYPQCRIDSSVKTVSAMKKKAHRLLVDDGERFIIDYKGQFPLRSLWSNLVDIGRPWIRFGPLIVAPLFSLSWNSIFSSMLLTVMNTSAIYAWARSKMNQQGEALNNLFKSSMEAAGHGTEAFVLALSHPFLVGLSILSLLCLLFQLLRLCLRPNALVVSREKLELSYRATGMAQTTSFLRWEDVLSAGLVKDKNGTAKISFNKKSGAPFLLDLSAIAPENRPRLTRALERFAPACVMEPSLSEALLPRRENSYTELWLQSLSSAPQRGNLQPLQPAQSLQEGRYSVIRRLGVGGQGTAYLCLDTESGKEVVLKETAVPVFSDRVVKELALKRFEKEAKILGDLDNPQIVKLEDYFYEDHRGYLVLEHVSGNNLRKHITEHGPLKENEVLELVLQMCAILKYLHAKEIIHRDFTPDNLILSDDGKLKLIDFNVAQQSQVGTTGTIAGKHAYLPPEQFRGKAQTASDIYAMGATLQFLLTGKDPEAICQSSPRQSGCRVSDELELLVSKATQLELGKRFKNIVEIEQLLACGQATTEPGQEKPTEPEFKTELETETLTIKLASKEKEAIES